MYYSVYWDQLSPKSQTGAACAIGNSILPNELFIIMLLDFTNFFLYSVFFFFLTKPFEREGESNINIKPTHRT